MTARIRFMVRAMVVTVMLLLSAVLSYGSHIFGVDLYYKHVSGNTYTIFLTVFGDCSGAAFASLPSSNPVVNVYNGNAYITAVTLSVQAPVGGVEVSPVCIADAGNTTCTNPASPLPGIKKFVFAGNVTLSGPATTWRFLFQGDMGSGGQAGRSNTITNITIPGIGSPIQLVDTLNNSLAPNNSPGYTSIATPYFCVDLPANYNPGAVDSDGDALTFALVPGIDANTGSSVNYVFPFTASNPLAVSAGTLALNSANGQLSFTPNVVQRSLVVYNVEERRGGILVGTSQREMSFIAINSCTGAPPYGAITTATAGSVISATQINLCSNTGAFSFHINPTTASGDTIIMSVTGIPTGAIFNIVNNNTPAPSGTLSWTTTGVFPGIYTFYITYIAESCPIATSQTIAYTVFIMPAPNTTATVLTPVTCTREAMVRIMPSGGPPPFSITVMSGSTTFYSHTGVTGAITDSLPAGTYTIRTYNAYDCFTDATFTLISPPLPTPVVAAMPPLCAGGATGSATITGTHGTAPYTYAIDARVFSSSGIFSGLSAGSYTLAVRDANGCTADSVITISSATPILYTTNITKPTCNNFSTGSIVITAYNTVAPYTYSLDGGAYSGTDTFTTLPAGTYTINITDGNGCMATTTSILTDSENIHANLGIIPIQCYGDSATIAIFATGGFAPPYTYAYNLSPFGSSNTFTLPAGGYTLHIQDSLSCYFDTTIALTQPSPLSFVPAITNVLCYGTASGSVLASVSGGTTGYMYDTLGGTLSPSPLITGLSAGIHTIQVYDANGCIYNEIITISQPPLLTIYSVIPTMPQCHNDSSGMFTITAAGGTPAYSYAINGGLYSASSSISGLPAGIYTISVMDANGCSHDTIVTLAQPSAINATTVINNATCSGLADGTVTLIATGGTPPYTYAADAGGYGVSNVLTGLAAGVHTFYIRDAHGCIYNMSVSIGNALAVSGNFTLTPVSCYNGTNGAIAVSGVGGASPYMYELGGLGYSATNVFSGLSMGLYPVSIEDANGCIQDTTVLITQPMALTLSAISTQPTCYGYNNGSCTLSPAGGTAPYQLSVDGSVYAAATVYTLLPAGVFSISVLDVNNCIYDSIISIGQPTKLIITGIALTNVSCNGGANGTTSINVSGATPPYAFAVNGGVFQTNNLLTGLAAGNQMIQVLDSQGCKADTSLTITQPMPLVFTGADTVNPTCQGYTNGSVMLYVAGGTPPYQYSKDNITFYNNPFFSSFIEGTYSFYVLDTNLCAADTTITLTGYPHILYDNIAITEPLCTGYHDGAISVSGSGGVQPLSYALKGGSYIYTPPATYDSLFSGAYVITITDSKNCYKDSVVQVLQPDTLKIALAITPNDCYSNGDNGAITANVSGGTKPYSYLWGDNNIAIGDSSYVTKLPNSTYTVYVADAHHCDDTATGIVQYGDCCTPFVPTAFTPNNDGKDDFFGLQVKGDMRIIIFEVFNRYGQRIYYTEYKQGTWDGTFNGVPQDSGVYFWFAKVICGNALDHIVELKGDVTLLR